MNCEDRPKAHAARIEPRIRISANVTQRLNAVALNEFLVRDEQRGCAVGDLAGVADSDAAVAAIEDRLELREGLHRLISSRAVVARHGLKMFPRINRDHLFIK